jgi:O-antigen/teichoic acid export membrane protein
MEQSTLNQPSPAGALTRLRTDTLASSVLLLLAATMLQRTIGFGRGVLFCRWLSPETLGQWEMVYSFLLLAAPLAVLGVPGSYGRYVEHFRQRGHLHTFLWRTSIWTLVWSTAAVGAIMAFAPWFSQLLFGNAEGVGLVRGTALCLAAVILHHTLTSLLTALRLFRIVTAMNFAQSLLFATVALTLLLTNASVASIVTGYGAACLVASAGAILWVWPGIRALDRPDAHLPQIEFWPRLLRFAFFVWVTNLLAHLFAVVDRYMIVHFSGMSSAEALDQVGYYHSSRIVPLLLISFADLLSGLVMPHLSSDWEAGRRDEVGRQNNLCVKLTGLGMLAFGVCVLLFAPLLFDVILQGRYSDGLVVLPWTLTGCVWYGVYSVAQNYLWCAERARLATAPLALGLVLNVVLNLLLLPLWGLYGAVVATALATAACLAAILILSRRHGMTLDHGTWLVVAAPLALSQGTLASAATLVVLTIASLGTNLILTPRERIQLRGLMAEHLARLKPWLRRKTASPANA